MYCNKENVNILTALLVAHGVRRAVVCPGSRNAPIVHNLHECGDIVCTPVTDERSAGFYALGMALYVREPVVVCVTSGTALLNLMPAVAEAFYQHVPLVVISADRPPQWIGQQDGQTIPQPDALGRFVKKAVMLPETHDKETRWYCNRLVNEAILATRKHGGGPVHINVPISEPLYEFTVATLPEERKIWSCFSRELNKENEDELRSRLNKAQRPLIVMGQMEMANMTMLGATTMSGRGFVLCEPLSQENSCGLDELMEAVGDDERFVPDFVLYTGGHIVSKRLKKFLRGLDDVEMWQVSIDGELNDTYMHVSYVMEGDLTTSPDLFKNPDGSEGEYYRLWANAYEWVKRQLCETPLTYSAEAVVRYFEQQFEPLDCFSLRHYANSTAIRLGCRYSREHIFCNRGVNGIEGTLSTAAGMSMVADDIVDMVVCVVGDLSFFYDQNALWNENLRGNLRVLLLNDGGGTIFNRFDGLRQSAAHDMITGVHHTHAEGICRQNNVGYRSACDMKTAEEGIEWLLRSHSDTPLVLEVYFNS